MIYQTLSLPMTLSDLEGACPPIQTITGLRNKSVIVSA